MASATASSIQRLTPNDKRQRRAGRSTAKNDAGSSASAARMGWASHFVSAQLTTLV